MVRLIREQLSQDDVLTNTDEVLLWAQIPEEGSLNNLSGEMHCMKSSQAAVTQAFLYGVKGIVLPDNDPDTPANGNDIWARHMEADADFGADILDLDTAGSASGPEWEPGEPNANELFDIHTYDDDAEFFRRRKLITFASTSRGFDAGTPPGDWLPTDVFPVGNRKRVFVDIPSWALVGFSSPAVDDVTATMQLFGSTQEWLMLKYVREAMRLAWPHIVGLIEAGAETPFEDVAAFLEDYLVPTVYEDVVDTFQPATWRVWAMANWDISVPGDMDTDGVISANG